jgi:hypothetical protein
MLLSELQAMSPRQIATMKKFDDAACWLDSLSWRMSGSLVAEGSVKGATKSSSPGSQSVATRTSGDVLEGDPLRFHETPRPVAAPIAGPVAAFAREVVGKDDELAPAVEGDVVLGAVAAEDEAAVDGVRKVRTHPRDGEAVQECG